ncbi:hypothetical protein E2C01_070154 [Portunus trituberculatus]|uniref:Uncharacterized protein n=1 Tax=Portunus trituberculatus TaxID=210409 RepID=A0A5B7HTF8_PORTR|nr:hypothetical protein [Portunus trituberculatus]
MYHLSGFESVSTRGLETDGKTAGVSVMYDVTLGRVCASAFMRTQEGKKLSSLRPFCAAVCVMSCLECPCACSRIASLAVSPDVRVDVRLGHTDTTYQPLVSPGKPPPG